MADYPELLAKGHNPSYVFRGTKADIYEGGTPHPSDCAVAGKGAEGKKVFPNGLPE